MGRWLHRILGPREISEGENHIPLEDLARLAEGRVDREDREGLMRHLNRCRACYEILRETLADMSGEQARSKGSRRPLYALAASIVLCALIGGGIFFKYPGGPKGAIIASFVMDEGLRNILLEDETVHWTKGERVDRLAALLREKGVRVKDLERVELSEPYFASKDLFGPEEILHIRIEKGVAYLEVVEEKQKE